MLTRVTDFTGHARTFAYASSMVASVAAASVLVTYSYTASHCCRRHFKYSSRLRACGNHSANQVQGQDSAYKENFRVICLLRGFSGCAREPGLGADKHDISCRVRLVHGCNRGSTTTMKAVDTGSAPPTVARGQHRQRAARSAPPGLPAGLAAGRGCCGCGPAAPQRPAPRCSCRQSPCRTCRRRARTRWGLGAREDSTRGMQAATRVKSTISTEVLQYCCLGSYASGFSISNGAPCPLWPYGVVRPFRNTRSVRGSEKMRTCRMQCGHTTDTIRHYPGRWRAEGASIAPL